MSKSLQFYLPQRLAVFTLGMTILFMLLETGPVMMAFSILLLAVLIGIISPINSKKHPREIEELAIQQVDRKYIFSNKIRITSTAFLVSAVSAFILLILNAFLPLNIENKVAFSAVIVINGCLAPFAYRSAAVLSIKYAETLK